MRHFTRCIIASASLLLATAAWAQGPLLSPACAATAKPIAEESFVPIGGIELWTTITGASCANPVILFLHGGPGNPMSPYAQNVYGAWEKEFTLVQWDQRSAGRTYGRNRASAETPLTLERMTRDGIELTEYLLARLGKRKVILMGGSWGSVLGVTMAKARPDLFHAYVGSGQMVNYRENQDATYRKTLELLRAAGDSKTLAAIEALGAPPWTNPRNSGLMRRATRVVEAKTATPPPPSWWAPAAQYATPAMLADYESGDDFSYIQFVGMKGDGMAQQIDLPKLGLNFGMPVYLINGADDLVTTPEVARKYFDAITAPAKEFVLLPRTGHDPNGAMVDAQYAILKTRVLPALAR